MQRAELVQKLGVSRKEMEAALAGCSEAQLTAPGALGAWSMKDLLAHLTVWEAEAVRVTAKLRQGQKASPAGSTPAEIDALNAEWYADNQDRPLTSVLADFRGVRKQLLRQVEALSEQDLQRKAPGTNDTLLALILGETLEHEAEHAEAVRAWREAQA